MVRHTLAIGLAAALTAGTAYAQQTTVVPTPPQVQQEKPAPRPQPEGQPNNIKVELSISDQSGPGTAPKRIVSMIVADRHTGSVRSQGGPTQPSRTATVNVDAAPTVVKDSLMRVQLGLEYYPASGEGAAANELRVLNQRMTLWVESGKTVIVAQTSDPTSDRKMTVELTATILK